MKVMSEQKQLSLCIITKNDEAFFPGCLKDMEGAVDEMIVVDLGSDDRTPELARQVGASVYQPVWKDDFSQIKNFCMDHAAGRWVLFLQADEVISPDQLKELKLLLQNPAAEGYLFDVEDQQEGKGISSPVQFLRLIRNRKNYRFRYRSVEYIPDEELYSLLSAGLRIMRRRERGVGWQSEERTRLLQLDLKEHPQDSYICYLQGIELLNQKKYEEGAAFFELARKAVSGGYLYVPHLFKCFGLCLLSLGRIEEAEEVLTEGFWLFSFYTDLLVLRAELYHRIGRNEEALKDLQTCLAIQKGPNVRVPVPKIDISAVEKMLEEIQASHPECDN